MCCEYVSTTYSFRVYVFTVLKLSENNFPADPEMGRFSRLKKSPDKAVQALYGYINARQGSSRSGLWRRGDKEKSGSEKPLLKSLLAPP